MCNHLPTNLLTTYPSTASGNRKDGGTDFKQIMIQLLAPSFDSSESHFILFLFLHVKMKFLELIISAW